MKKIKTKIELSVSLNKDIIKYIKENYTNRSKFIEYCIVHELNRFDKYKEIIK